MIELKSISGSFLAGRVTDVSFRLPNGKTYGVFSPCYEDAVCLLALMSGARTPTSGSVLAGGFDLHREAKQVRRSVGFLSADLLPDDELTPIEYLMTVADVLELPYDKTVRRAHELLELADLSQKKDRLIANLSHGEKRILCLLQLLLGKPEFLMLTSPLSGLMARDAQKMRELIAFLGDTHTIFLCTPSTNDLSEMCDEVLILQDGTLKTTASADDEALVAEISAPTAEVVPETKSAPKTNREKALWKLLTQTSKDYEVLDDEDKEGKN